MERIGKIVQVIGPVVDVEFEPGQMPGIYECLRTEQDGRTVAMEVLSHLDNRTARAIAMHSTDGLQRGWEVIATGSQIAVPVGEEVLGRIMNVMGEPIDKRGEIPAAERCSIHRKAPEFFEQSHTQQIFETGIKVIDLLAPYAKGGKIGLFGGAGVGKTVLIMELMRSIAHASSAPNIALVDAMSLIWLLLMLLVMVVLELLSSRGSLACPAAGGSRGGRRRHFLPPLDSM